jgi:type I restriction enzyme M protein
LAKRKNNASTANATAATIGYEAQLWQMADAPRGSMDAAEYKHVVLGLVFLKYISDPFEEHHRKLETERSEGADLEDPDEYRAFNIFWVPPEARWERLQQNARQPNIGQFVDEAMAAVERDNPSLKGVLPKDYVRPALDKQRLGQLIDVVTNIRVGDAEARSKAVLGRVYEYFLGQFASAEGKSGLHGRAAGPALLLHADPGLPVVPRARHVQTPLSQRERGRGCGAAARSFSSTPASWAGWWTAPTGN